MAGCAFGFLGFLEAGLLDIFRQVTGGFTSHPLMEGIFQMLERRRRLWKHYCKKHTTPGQTIEFVHSFEISSDLVDNGAPPDVHGRVKPEFSKNFIECTRQSQKVNLHKGKA